MTNLTIKQKVRRAVWRRLEAESKFTGRPAPLLEPAENVDEDPFDNFTIGTVDERRLFLVKVYGGGKSFRVREI